MELAERHLAAADLLVQDLPDAAYFHVYHAFECAVTARLLDLDPSMPPAHGHADRIADFLERETDAALTQLGATLAPRLDLRNQALYIGVSRGRIRRPRELFDSHKVDRLTMRVRDFLDALRSG